MPSIHEEAVINAAPDTVWSVLKNVGEAHKAFAPVLVDCQLAGDVRTLRFGNGMVLREQLLEVNDERRRVAYTVIESSMMKFHHASMEVRDAGRGLSLFVWITDFLPAELGAQIAPLMAQGAQALKKNIEGR